MPLNSIYPTNKKQKWIALWYAIKKIMISITFLLLSTSYINGQSESRFKGGVHAGINLSQISGDQLSGFHKMGAYLGLFANVPINKEQSWKVQMELNFTMKGSKTHTPPRSNATLPKNIYKLNLYYAEIPILFKYVALRGIELEVGPALGYLFSHKETENGDPIIGRPSFSNFDFSGMIGATFCFKEHYGLSIRYSNSIIPIRTPNWVINQWVKKQLNSCIIVSINYQF